MGSHSLNKKQMDTKKLHQKILDLAIHGKLVPPVCRQAGKILTMNPEPPIKGKKCWFTYVIECEDGSFYKGYTDDLLRRYKQHCDGNGAEYTKKHKPKQLYYWEMHYTQENALNREKYLKSGIGREWFKREVVDKPENFEPASVLLERIRAEKERLIKEGKIKKSKASKTSDTPHYENVPFEIPSSWVWTTVNAIAKSILYGVSESAKTCGKYKLLRITDIQNNNVQWDTVPYTDFDTNKAESYLLNDGDILFARTGATVGKSYLVQGLKEEAIYASYLIRVQTYDAVLPQYVKFYFESGYYWEQIVQESVGVGQPNVNGTILGNLNIPIPPIHEQDRIVSELSKWMGIIDVIEQGKIDLQTVIKEAKSKILDLAIHGKLVPQDPNDEPTSELLKRINHAAEITCDNGHYQNLPKGWCTTSIKNICDNINGLWKGKKDPFINVGVIRNANFTKDFKLDYSNIEYIDVEQRAFSQRHLKNGDLIIEKSGGSDNYPVGRAILYEGKDELYSFSNFTMVLRIKDKNIISSKFLYYFLLDKYKKGVMRTMQTQTTGLHNLILDKYLSMELCIPPYSEQKRIIDAIEELFDKLDAIMESL